MGRLPAVRGWGHDNDVIIVNIIKLGADECLLSSRSDFNPQSTASLGEDEIGQEDSGV